MIQKIKIFISLIVCLIGAPFLYAQGGEVPALMRMTREVVPLVERGVYQAEVHSIYRQGIELFQNSVFYAKGKIGSAPWSGTVFTLGENDHSKVYGVIVADALAVRPKNFIEEAMAANALKRHFTLKMFDKEGYVRTLSGRVVWLSSPKMWNLALVEFEPQDEVLFTPFVLSEKAPALGDFVQQQGFSRDLSIYIPNREIIASEPPLFYTTMPLPREGHLGLGGSPVFITRNIAANGLPEVELVGIHDDVVLGETPQGDMGYVTSSDFLRKFVEDYQVGGEQSFPLTFRGKKLFNITADEYINSVTFLDQDGSRIYRYLFKSRFSQRELESLVSTFRPCSIEFAIKKIRWSRANPEYVEPSQQTRRVVYNLQLGRVEP